VKEGIFAVAKTIRSRGDKRYFSYWILRFEPMAGSKLFSPPTSSHIHIHIFPRPTGGFQFFVIPIFAGIKKARTPDSDVKALLEGRCHEDLFRTFGFLFPTKDIREGRTDKADDHHPELHTIRNDDFGGYYNPDGPPIVVCGRFRSVFILYGPDRISKRDFSIESGVCLA
jgi:hypothetical protein